MQEWTCEKGFRKHDCWQDKPYPDKVNESIVDVSATWHEETTTRAEIMKEEKFLIL